MPPEAVREALINAVVHTDDSQRGAPIRLSIFDDLLEIENPGLLPFGNPSWPRLVAHEPLKAWIQSLGHDFPRTHDLNFLCQLIRSPMWPH